MKRDWTSQTAILLFGGILVAINLIGLNLFGRLDLTDDSVYTLSDASIRLVEGLDDPVTIVAFFTADLPPQYATVRRILKDKLDDYRAYGGQNVQYRFVDPADDEELREEAARYRIPTLQIQVLERDNVQLKNAYMGVAIQYADKREVIPVIEEVSRLEYDLTTAIRRLTRDRKPVAGFLAGHGEPDPMQDLPALQEELAANYDVRPVSAADLTGDAAPDVAMVIAPTDTVGEEDLRALDAFVMDGGRVAFLVNRVAASLQAGQAEERDLGLEPLLATYGIAVTPNLIMDEQNSVITLQRRQGLFNISQQIEYPLFPVATNFNADNQMVNRLQEVLFFFVSSIDTSQVLPDGVTMEPLVYSSHQSGVQQGFFMLQPMQTSATLSGGPYPLAAAYTGRFPSAFEPGRSSAPTRIVAVGDGDFVNESMVGAIPGNVRFGLNMVDWLVQDEAFLAIRSKSIEPRSLRQSSESMRPWIKYGNMVGPVILVVLLGFVRWRRRRDRQIVVVQSQ